MTDGFQPSGTQSCNISIRSVRRVLPIRRRFHLDPARMSEISAARLEGQRGPGRGPSRAGLAAISIFLGRGKTCARPAQLLHAQTRYIPAPMHICEGRGRPASRLTDFTISMLIRTAENLGTSRQKYYEVSLFLPGWELPCAVWCLCRATVAREITEKKPCGPCGQPARLDPGKQAKKAGGLHQVRDG